MGITQITHIIQIIDRNIKCIILGIVLDKYGIAKVIPVIII